MTATSPPSTGLFLGTGTALATGGPASLLICHAVVGAVVLVTTLSLSEMAAYAAGCGGCGAAAARYVDAALGFALAWTRWLHDVGAAAADLVALQLLVRYWDCSEEAWAWAWAPGVAAWALLLAANAREHQQQQQQQQLEYFWLGLLNAATVVAFVAVSIAVNCGANVAGEYIGARYWRAEGAFVDGLGGFASVFVTASFAYGGTRGSSPGAVVPRCRVRRAVWRVLGVYVLSVLMVGLNVPHDYPGLSTRTSKASPFTIAFQLAGATVAGSCMNAVIMLSAVAAANQTLFAGSRLLYTLAAVDGYAPGVFGRLTRQQVPLVAVMATYALAGLLFGLSFVGAGQVWTWLQNMVGVSNQLSWISIAVASLRFRAGIKAQGKEDLLPYKNWTYPWGPVAVVGLESVMVLVQGWSCFSPHFSPVDFVSYYIELPVFLLMYVAWKLVNKTKFQRASEMDLETDVYTKECVEDEGRTWKERVRDMDAWLCF